MSSALARETTCSNTPVPPPRQGRCPPAARPPSGRVDPALGGAALRSRQGRSPPLLPIFRDLLRANPKRTLRLVIAGRARWAEDEITADYARELGLGDAILIRPLDPKTRHMVHAAADVFLSLSDNEQETSLGARVLRHMITIRRL